MILRPYQQAAHDGAYEEWKTHQATMIVLPTATGKTVAFSHIIKNRPRGRCLVLAHREELIYQAVNKIVTICGERPEIEMADMTARAHGDMFSRPGVVVSTIQTQCAGCDGDRRMTRFDPMDFTMLIIDECHHAAAQTYRRVIDYYKQNPNLKILGVTATPDRADEKALGQIFESVAYDYEILDAINDGWLVPIMQRAVAVLGLDYSSVRTTAGDLNGADLERILKDEELIQRIVAPTVEIIGDQRTLVFAQSLAQAERMTEVFNRYKGEGAARFVHGKTEKEVRRDMLAAYAKGEFQLLVNVGVATEGFDDPGIEYVVMARPTKSRCLYAQMAGRGMRPAEAIAHRLNDVAEPEGRREMIADSNKPTCHIIDFVGNSGKHKLMTTADILGGRYDDDVVAKAKKMAEDAGGEAVDMGAELAEAERLIEEEKVRARRAALRLRADYRTSVVNPFDVLQIMPPRRAGWEDGANVKPPSPKMLDLLRKLTGRKKNGEGRLSEDQIQKLSLNEVKKLLDELIGRVKNKQCTFGQAQVLAKYGYRTDCTFAEASKVMNELAANKWQPIDGMEGMKATPATTTTERF